MCSQSAPLVFHSQHGNFQPRDKADTIDASAFLGVIIWLFVSQFPLSKRAPLIISVTLGERLPSVAESQLYEAMNGSGRAKSTYCLQRRTKWPQGNDTHQLNAALFRPHFHPSRECRDERKALSGVGLRL